VSAWTGLDQAFRERFGTRPGYHVHSPGRVNLIGEHTDYNDGFVLPVAIDRYLRIAAAAIDEPVIRCHSQHFAEEVEIPVDRPEERAAPAWARYIQGVAHELRRAGVALRGIEGVIGGELPIGAGLSSSAALEVAAALALLAAADATLDRRQVALLAQRAEVEFVGVRCGIMDQFAVALAESGHALLLDCRTLDLSHVPIPSRLVLVVCDTGVRRTLEESAYNERRRECEEVVERLRPVKPGLRALRDLNLQDIPLLEELPDPLGRRARHVVTENRRVLLAAEALRRGDGEAVGRLLAASHASLRDDYAVSVPALEAMISAAAAAPGCVGARLTGAGFGGAAVALVARPAVGAFVASAGAAYRATSGREGTFLICEAAGGAKVTTAFPDGTS
jgi:galactokinase